MRWSLAVALAAAALLVAALLGVAAGLLERAL
jgi:hypothetical protein